MSIPKMAVQEWIYGKYSSWVQFGLTATWDYDKLQDIVNNHRNMRQTLGHGMMDDDKSYPLQTLKDNISLLTSSINRTLYCLLIDKECYPDLLYAHER